MHALIWFHLTEVCVTTYMEREMIVLFYKARIFFFKDFYEVQLFKDFFLKFDWLIFSRIFMKFRIALKLTITITICKMHEAHSYMVYLMTF